MKCIIDGLMEAVRIVITLDPEFVGIVLVSVMVASASTSLATLFGVPFAILVARKMFWGRRAVITVLNTLMALPTVVVGLTVYSLLSRSGPLGSLGLLYTRTAMIIGQFILVFPIIAGLTVVSIGGLDQRIHRTALSLGADRAQSFRIFLHEARPAIIAAVIAGFGRVFAEVGVSMMVGGNIRGYTRNITTAIALETSKGEFSMGIALGIVLLTVALGINLVFSRLQRRDV
jgi:tungstate transport system permease protein